MEHLQQSLPTPNLQFKAQRTSQQREKKKRPEDEVEYCERMSSGHGMAVAHIVAAATCTDLFKIKPVKNCNMESGGGGACL